MCSSEGGPDDERAALAAAGEPAYRPVLFGEPQGMNLIAAGVLVALAANIAALWAE
jgi:hypothetical protein